MTQASHSVGRNDAQRDASQSPAPAHPLDSGHRENVTMNITTTTTTHPPTGASASRAPLRRRPSQKRALILWASCAAFAVATLAACGSMSQAVGESGYSYDASCPDNDLITILDFDLSDSGRDRNLLAERLDDAQIEIERTGDCGGRLIAGAHSTSSAATVTLLDVELHPEGATEIARDRKLEPLVTDTMKQLRAEIDAAMDRLPADGSDLTAGFQFIADQASRHASNKTTIDATLYTDAISNTGPLALNEPDATVDAAKRTAASAPDPSVSGINELRIEGVGHVAGKNQPPSDFVEVITTQVNAYLARTDATTTDALTALVGR
jgi:hypothetical protein